MPGYQSAVIGLEPAVTLVFTGFTLLLGLTPVIDVLAVGCLASWLREWRHDEQGRIFFTLLTAAALLLAVGLSVAFIRIVTGR